MNLDEYLDLHIHSPTKHLNVMRRFIIEMVVYIKLYY